MNKIKSFAVVNKGTIKPFLFFVEHIQVKINYGVKGKYMIVSGIARSKACLFFTYDFVYIHKFCKSIIQQGSKYFAQAAYYRHTSVIIMGTSGTLIFKNWTNEAYAPICLQSDRHNKT